MYAFTLPATSCVPQRIARILTMIALAYTAATQGQEIGDCIASAHLHVALPPPKLGIPAGAYPPHS